VVPGSRGKRLRSSASRKVPCSSKRASITAAAAADQSTLFEHTVWAHDDLVIPSIHTQQLKARTGPSSI
jgi:hypothetical protein